MAIETVIQKLSTEAMGRAAAKLVETQKPDIQGQSFRDVLSSVNDGNDFANMMDLGDKPDTGLTSRMEVLGGEGVSFNPATDVTVLSKPEASEKVLGMLGEVNKGQIQMDNLVNHILYSGQKFSNQELLVIQAHVFHFSQMTEMTVKVAEQGVSSVKTVLNTQIQ